MTLPWILETRGCRPGRGASSLSLPAYCLGLCLGCASDLGLGTWGGPPKSFSPLHPLSEAFLLPLPCRRALEDPAPPYFRAWSLSVPRTPHPSSVSPASLFIPERRDLGCSVYSAWCPNPSEWSGRESPPPDTFPQPQPTFSVPPWAAQFIHSLSLLLWLSKMTLHEILEERHHRAPAVSS